MGNALSSNRTRSALEQTWEQHQEYEFDKKDVDKTMLTMVGAGQGAFVNHVPVNSGGFDVQAISTFYAENFIPCMPEDTETELISRTIDDQEMRVVDELIFKFTHSVEMPWMLPGVPPTHRAVEVPLVAVVGFKDGKVAFERIYWDQASVLVQIGMLSENGLPVLGKEQAINVRFPDRDGHSMNDS